MRDLSLHLLKNSVAATMKRGIRTFCNNVVSTSTLNQRNKPTTTPSLVATSTTNGVAEDEDDVDQDDECRRSPLTLEEMILQLDMEEEAATRARQEEVEVQRRMSCVNRSDILRCARNALDQYPRFSLDGRDAMYRSSFQEVKIGRRVVLELPAMVGGERVVWCKPGVVPKLMGLEALPVPVGGGGGGRGRKRRPCKGMHGRLRRDRE